MRALSVYVHIPFCTVKCGYCDFNAYAGMHRLAPAYRDALLAEVQAWAGVLRGRDVATISFGGGTPSEVPAADIAAVVAALAGASNLRPDAEISLEANPGTLSLRQLLGLRQAGVNRLSLGAQSFHPDELRFLDRIHSAEATSACVRLARQAGFENVSLDLIYGLPGRRLSRWEDSLRQAMALGADHVSAYALTVEDGTPLAARVAERSVVPLDPDGVAVMYERATDLLAGAGYAQYELSSWARPGFESRHNQVYWCDGEYLGIGAGAHGYLDGERYENIAHPRAYITACLGQRPAGDSTPPRPAILRRERPARVIAMFDWLTLRLRLLEGFAPADFEAAFGCELEHAVGEALNRCRQAGLVASEGDVRLTRAGRLLHGEVAVQFLAELRALPPA